MHGCGKFKGLTICELKRSSIFDVTPLTQEHFDVHSPKAMGPNWSVTQVLFSTILDPQPATVRSMPRSSISELGKQIGVTLFSSNL